MATLENVYHNFPLLAKQSGFYFQLHRGRVNWSEIDDLNVDEITEKRNFQLLEENLINVINCNLEKEYDLKILDKNLVKLFKLAQLGVEYLSYCQMYLDKCVILLQEQLLAVQEECELLKQEYQKKKEELNKSKRKYKNQSYQCEKCEKVFISDVYLKFHDKRRHSFSNASENVDKSCQECLSNCQMTENGNKTSVFIQTEFHNEPTEVLQKHENETSVKDQHLIKIDNLEQELQDLKERLKKAESTLSEKTEASKPNPLPSLNIPGSIQYNSLLMLLPSNLTHSGNGQYEINLGSQNSGQNSVPEVYKSNNTVTPPSVQPDSAESKFLLETLPQLNAESEKPFGSRNEVPKEQNKFFIPEKPVNFKNYQTAEKESMNFDKENVDPNIKNHNITNLTKPLPPPRKLRKGLRPQPNEMNVMTKKESHAQEKLEGLIEPEFNLVKEKPQEETELEILEKSRESICEIEKPISNSIESLDSKKSVLFEAESKSFFEKMVSRSSPKLRRLSKNVKKSLTNLYDSVSSSENIKSSNNNLKSTTMERSNNRLKQLGGDSEWSGIPKKTMKQKLKDLKHQRTLLPKYNPMYPTIRKSIEEKICQKFKNLEKKTTFFKKFTKKESTSAEIQTIQNVPLEEKPEIVSLKNCAMYDIDSDSSSDSESRLSDLEQTVNHTNPDGVEKTLIVEELSSSEERLHVKKKEFDFSVFQVGSSGLSSAVGNQTRKKDDRMSDSDTETNLEDFEDKSFHKTFLDNKLRSRNDDVIVKDFSFEAEKVKQEEHKLFKDSDDYQSRLSTNAKKKVFFANYLSGVEEELSDNPTDDDLWSLKSDWQIKRAGT